MFTFVRSLGNTHLHCSLLHQERLIQLHMPETRTMLFFKVYKKLFYLDITEAYSNSGSEITEIFKHKLQKTLISYCFTSFYLSFWDREKHYVSLLKPPLFPRNHPNHKGGETWPHSRYLGHSWKISIQAHRSQDCKTIKLLKTCSPSTLKFGLAY